jgi:hypothetical protein
MAVEIAVRVHAIAQLFNSIDPSPFRERDIDASVEEFLVGWVRELPADTPVRVTVHLPSAEALKPEAAGIGEAFANYFAYRAQVVRRELRELFRVGRLTLGIGLVALVTCLVASQIAATTIPQPVVARVIEEGLIIVGWVSNWRPIEIYLYEWLPLRRRVRLFERLAAAEITVRPV